MYNESEGITEAIKGMRKALRPSSNKESEKDIEKYLTQQVESYGGKSYKWSSPSNKGVPDRVCILPGLKIFVEVKSEGESLSPLQKIVHKEMHQLINHVYVVDTKAAVDHLLNRLIWQEGLYGGDGY